MATLNDKDKAFDRLQVERAMNSSTSSFIRRRLEGGTFTSRRYRYLHVSAPKCACSTTKTLLWHLEGYGDPPIDIHSRPPGDPRLSAMSGGIANAIRLLFEDRSIIRFRVYRDPVSRLASAYIDKIKNGGEPFAKQRNLVLSHFGLADPDRLSFDHFAEYVCAQPDCERDQHWMSQRRLTLADAISFDFVIPLESYKASMSSLLDALRVPRAERPPLEIWLNRTPGEKPRIPPATARLIQEAFSGDYDLAPIVPRLK